MPSPRILLGMILTIGLGVVVARAERPQENGAWRLTDGAAMNATAGVREPWIQPEKFQGCLLDGPRLIDELARVPLEGTVVATGPAIISLPMPDGAFARFWVYESSVMAPELAAKFPEIRTYAGQGIDDPAATVRFDWTVQGFHAQILSPNGAAYIDPYWKNDVEFYASYWKRDYRRGGGFSCLVDELHDDHAHAIAATAAVLDSDTKLRTYRLAVAATGEYTNFHGGTVNAGLSAIVTAVNRVTGIYENDLGVRLQLIANNNLIVYTNPSTDPYTNNDGFSMLSQNQSNLNSVIGAANYDVGHVFSTGGGGVASLGVVCINSSKARGVTGLPNPTGDPFYVDYVAHELGHQYGANHSFNGTSSSCCCGNRNGSTAYEPGSGASIMAYAGICGADNIQFNSDPKFHSVSLDEITNFVTNGNGRLCPVVTETGNTSPIVSAGVNYTIPANTPFQLTATGSDSDGDTVTYSWEQRDLGPAATLAAPDNGTSPIVRSWNPVLSPVRIIPRLSNLLNNTLPAGEKLPSVNRNMKFRVVARDNRAGGGAFSTGNITVTVTQTAGPFQVTRPNTAMTLSGVESIEWNRANTHQSPVNASTVDIYLSTDGGQTFPMLLAEAVPNTGSALVGMPDMNTTTARIKVQGTNNIFFDISNTNFTIQSCAVPAAPLAVGGDPGKNRFASLVPGNPGANVAMRVVLAELPPELAHKVGEKRWIGPPQQFADLSGTFWAAPLQCDAYFRNWDGIGELHVYGPEIVPDALYSVQAIRCNTGDDSGFSGETFVATTVWGDVAAPFAFESGSQPDVLDVAAMVDRITELPGAIPRVQGALQPAGLNPAANPNVIDVSLVVDALTGFIYPFEITTTCLP